MSACQRCNAPTRRELDNPNLCQKCFNRSADRIGVWVFCGIVAGVIAMLAYGGCR